jgi:hypothetical protein
MDLDADAVRRLGELFGEGLSLLEAGTAPDARVARTQA